ncbi:hypothetical protein [Streptococcus fryi]
MEEKEWIACFEVINGRKPTPSELKKAYDERIILSNQRHLSTWYLVATLSIISLFLVIYVLVIRDPVQEKITHLGISKVSKSDPVIDSQRSESISKRIEGDDDSKSHVQENDGSIDIIAIQSGDYESISGLWQSEYSDGLIDLNWEEYFRDYQLSFEGNVIVLTPLDRAGAPTLKIIPRGVEATVPVGLLPYRMPTLSSVDRVIMSGVTTDVYYRENDFSKIPNSVYSMTLIEKLHRRIIDYRLSLDESYRAKADKISQHFTSDSLSYLETRDFILNDSIKEGIVGFSGKTTKIENIRLSGDIVTMTVDYTGVFKYSDGREESIKGTRDYVMKKVGDDYLIQSL